MTDSIPTPKRDPGSFRDGAGYVFLNGDHVLRTINARALDHFQAVQASGVLDALIAGGQVLGFEELDPAALDLAALRGARGETPARVLRQPRLPLITYPYEWTFGQLRDAASAHLAIQIAALDRNVVLSDATPYNLQLVGGRAVHIDLLSFRPYRDGETWGAYHQFCRLFLLPLLLEAWGGIAFQPFLKARVDGVELGEAVRLLPWRHRFLRLSGLMHVTLHALSERRHSSDRHDLKIAPPVLPKTRYRALLTELKVLVDGLASARSDPTFWTRYDARNSYTDTMRDTKRAFVADIVRRLDLRSIWDLGGNSGDFSVAALDAGCELAVVLDSDLDSLERAWMRSRGGATGLLPLVIDCADPSPSRGWAQAERRGLHERRHADGVLALALIHHLAIGRNVPLAAVIDWLLSLAPAGIVEFVPKTDPMVEQMLRHRDDIFADYDEGTCRALLSSRAEIVAEHRFADNGRVLFAWRRASSMESP
jgi:hypothetical protein